LAAFFLAGAGISGATCVALLFPGGPLDPMWRLNPQAHEAFGRMGAWAIVLMLVVSVACGLAARGLWRGTRWGQRLTLGILTVNLVGDAVGAVVRHDPRTLIGLPVGGVMIAYLLSARVRAHLQREQS